MQENSRLMTREQFLEMLVEHAFCRGESLVNPAEAVNIDQLFSTEHLPSSGATWGLSTPSRWWKWGSRDGSGNC